MARQYADHIEGYDEKIETLGLLPRKKEKAAAKDGGGSGEG
jgi:hypothetical protein